MCQVEWLVGCRIVGRFSLPSTYVVEWERPFSSSEGAEPREADQYTCQVTSRLWRMGHFTGLRRADFGKWYRSTLAPYSKSPMRSPPNNTRHRGMYSFASKHAVDAR